MKIDEYLSSERGGLLFIGPYKGGKSRKSAVIRWNKDNPTPHWSLIVLERDHFMNDLMMNSFVDHEVLAGLGFDQLDKAKEKANEILGVTEKIGKDINYAYPWRWRKGKGGGAYGMYCWRGV